MPCRSKKHCHVFRNGVAPDPLVDPGNPSYHDQARATAHPTRPCHRGVDLATRSPSRSASRPSQTKNATVMLRRGNSTRKVFGKYFFLQLPSPGDVIRVRDFHGDEVIVLKVAHIEHLAQP